MCAFFDAPTQAAHVWDSSRRRHLTITSHAIFLAQMPAGFVHLRIAEAHVRLS